MEWVYVLIVLIPLLVWVLSTIVRGPDQGKELPRRPAAPDGAPLQVQRRQGNDLDRFLQDTMRRREKKASQKKAQEADEPLPMRDLAAQPPPPPPPPPPPAPAAKLPSPRPRKDDSAPRPRKDSAPPERPLAERLAAREAAASPPTPLEAPRPATAAPRAPSRPAPAAALLARLAGMMRDRKSLAAGLVLAEVLNRPLSQRPRR